MHGRPLFTGANFRDVAQTRSKAAVERVDQWDADDLLSRSTEEVQAAILEDVSYVELNVSWDEAYSTGPKEERFSHNQFGDYVTTAGTTLPVRIPYTGSAVLFDLAASTISSSRPYGEVDGQELVVALQAAGVPTADAVTGFIEGIKSKIDKHASWINGDVGRHRQELRVLINTRVEDRRKRLLEARDLTASLPIPIRPKATSDRYPVAAKRRRVRLVEQTTTTFKPEPELENAIYEDVLRACAGWATTLERNPRTLGKLDEEELRDLLLSALNANYEGQAGGELFNGAGKTDILVRWQDRNVFIGECKFWSGKVALTEALNQLLSYLVWRDTKAALLLFIRTKDAVNTIEKADAAIREHPGLPPLRLTRGVDCGQAA